MVEVTLLHRYSSPSPVRSRTVPGAQRAAGASQGDLGDAHSRLGRSASRLGRSDSERYMQRVHAWLSAVRWPKTANPPSANDAIEAQTTSTGCPR